MVTTFGKYTIEKKLGEGGMGAVYLAVDPALNRKVALKIITSDDPELLERFQREASAVAQLKHPNIVPVYEAGVVNGQNYFTMDYIEGVSLEKFIGLDKRPSVQNIAKIIYQVAVALHYAHSQELVHRDIKPANILIDRQGKAYIADFGLAKQLTGLDRSLTITGATVGTPSYMSPEQAMGLKDQIDTRTDIFGLGATLYHCITGRVPFSGREILEVLTKVVNNDPPLPSSVITGIPKDLETICLKCLEKDKAKRYQSAAELATDIKRYLQGEPVAAKRTPHISKLWFRARKNKAISLSIAGAVVILLAVIIGLMLSSAGASRKVEQFRKEALSYADAGDYDKALIACEQIRTITMSDEEINALHAECKIRITRRAKAKEVLARASAVQTPDEKIRIAEDALKIDQTSADAYQLIGYAYKDKAKSAKDGRRELIMKAAEYFTRAIDANPKQAYSYYERALITADMRDNLEAAIPDFEKVLECDPGSHIGWFAKGNIENSQKKYDDAIASFSKAIELYPKYTWAYNNRGLAYADAGNYDKAIADYNTVLRIDPNDADAYYNRGATYADKVERERNPAEWRDLMDKAIADYDEAIRLDPKSARAFNNRGFAYYNKVERERNPAGQRELLDQAISDYTEALRLDPRLAQAFYNRGLAYQNKGELDRAISDYTEALRLNPQYARAYYNRGNTYSDKAERERSPDVCRELIDKAISDYTEALRLNPQYATAYYNRGNAYYSKAQSAGGSESADGAPSALIDRAIADYNKAIELNPNDADAYGNRGFAYAWNKDYQRAIGDLERFLELAPNDPQAEQMKNVLKEMKRQVK